MGAEPWSYFIAFEPDVESALQKLRKRVFDSGEFNGSELNPSTPEEAMEQTSPDGTRSILDMFRVSEEPDYFSVCALSDEDLRTYFGTAAPTHEMIDGNSDFFEYIERGQGIYIVVYKDNQPTEYFFAGYSFD